MEECALEVNVHDLPDDCLETAERPGELFRKLDEWGHDSIVIPHGTTWGFYTPPGPTWDKQLTAAENDPDRQVLFEIYSGHGDSDELMRWLSGMEQPPRRVFVTHGEDQFSAFRGTFAGGSIFNPRSRGVVFAVPSRMAEHARNLLEEFDANETHEGGAG